MNTNRKAIIWYVTIMMVLTFGFGTLEQIFQTGLFYSILQKGFTFFPILTALLVRMLLKEKFKIKFSIKVWKNWRMWLFCAFVPGIAIALGAVLYFVIFRGDYSKVFQLGLLFGADLSIPISNSFQFVMVCILISAAFIPLQLLELGEEVGWRGYLLWHQTEQYGVRKAVMINSIEWGLVHLPLIFFGFNYSSENLGAPWTNMLLMMLVCLSLGIIFSYVALKTTNCMYSAIMHGVMNLIGEIPVFCSISLKSGLLGPNPTGLVSMSFLILLAIVLYIKMPVRD